MREAPLRGVSTMADEPRTAEHLLQLLARRGLVAELDLQALLLEEAWPATARDLAARLVAGGLLTDFQAAQLLKGKWRNFFLGKYKVLRPIARGGMGRVLLCQHTSLDRLVALKVIPAQ